MRDHGHVNAVLSRLMATSVQVLTSSADSLEALRETVRWGDEIHCAYAWASQRGPWKEHWNAVRKANLVRVVIGLHFDRTDPSCLRDLHDARVPLRVWRSFDAVFHPKVLVAVRGKRARALIGSSNLTPGGFAANQEANVLLSGVAHDDGPRELLSAIGRWWTRGARVTPKWLDDYESRFVVRERLERQWRAANGVRDPNDELPPDLDRPWAQYFALFKARNREHNVLPVPRAREVCGLEEIERFHAPLSGAPAAGIDPAAWRIVGGYGGSASGWFGPVRHWGVQAWLKRESRQIYRRLAAIPASGAGQRVVGPAKSFLRWALRQRFVSIGSASRLLMARRPDLFLCVNAANLARLSEQFQLRIGLKDGDAYFQLHDRIWRLAWHASPAPNDPLERRVWAHRTALLDALLYRESPAIPKQRRARRR